MNLLTTNINPETGVHYGVVALAYLDADVADNLMFGSQATDLSFKQWEEDMKATYEDWRQEAMENLPDALEGYIEIESSETWAPSADNYIQDEPLISGVLDGVNYQVFWLGGAPHIMVFDSPHQTLCYPCSPCVPNAGDLTKENEGTITAYTVPSDWWGETQ